MTTTPAVDDFAYIRERLAELEGNKRAAEAPKAWPDFTPVDTAYSPEAVTETVWGHYSAPDQDCAWRPAAAWLRERAEQHRRRWQSIYVGRPDA